MNVGQYDPMIPGGEPEETGKKRKRDEDGQGPNAKRARFDIGDMVHRVHVLAHLRELQLQNHPDLAELVHKVALHSTEFSLQQKQEILSDVAAIKQNIQGERREKRVVTLEIDDLVTALKPRAKRLREEDVEAAPEAKRARPNPFKELNSCLEGYLQGTTDISEVLEEVFKDLQNKEVTIEKASYIIEQMKQVETKEGYLVTIKNLIIDFFDHQPRTGDPKILRILVKQRLKESVVIGREVISIHSLNPFTITRCLINLNI